MSLAKRCYKPGFSTLALLALAACSGGGGSSTATSTPASVVIPDVPNVYSSDDTSTYPLDLDNLLVFGDSYSNGDRSIFRLWHEIVVVGVTNNQGTATLESYGTSAASARDTGVYTGHEANTMDRQVDNWLATNPTFQAGDATVVWFGYNDVNQLSDLTQSKTDHTNQIQRIIDAGAIQDDRRLFVPNLHDWERNPSQQNDGIDKRDRVLDWNSHVADLANGNDQIVMVDLFTVFERVFNDPAAFNFTDVTTAHPEDGGFNDYTENLFVDDSHFGLHGHDIIAETFNHYLTRGYDWANTLEAGAAASAQLEQDIDEGRIDRLNKPDALSLGFSSYAIGEGREQMINELRGEDYVDPARSGYAGLRFNEEADSGIGLDYAFTETNSVGLVFSDYSEREQTSFGLNTSDLDYDNRAVSMYVAGETGGLHWRSLASASHDEHTKHDKNGLATSGNRASFEGETTRLAQSVSKPFRAGNAWLTPWANFSYSKQKVDGFTIGNALVSDLKYSDAEVSESFGTVGLNAAFDPMAITRDSSLSLRGGFSYSRSLHRDDREVTITETATGLSSTETIEQEAIETMQLRLGADLAVGEAVSLTSDYLLTKQMGVEADQSLMLNLRYRF